MKSAIRKWGNSAALRLPAKAMAVAGLDIDCPVEIDAKEGVLVIRSVKKYAYTLEGLLARCSAKKVALTDEDRHWLDSDPTGEEIW